MTLINSFVYYNEELYYKIILKNNKNIIKQL